MEVLLLLLLNLDAAFESGYLWGILNQYPLDLSISLGQIVLQQVKENKMLFGKPIHKSCLANQIVKYMTGINSFDLVFLVSLKLCVNKQMKRK